MSAKDTERFLARLYVDREARELFLEDPETEALRAGLSTEEAESFARMDRNSLLLAAASYEKKRAGKLRPGAANSGKRLIHRALDAFISRTNHTFWKNLK